MPFLVSDTSQVRAESLVEELKMPLANATIASGGVLPNIHVALIKPSGKGK